MGPFLTLSCRLFPKLEATTKKGYVQATVLSSIQVVPSEVFAQASKVVSVECIEKSYPTDMGTIGQEGLCR